MSHPGCETTKGDNNRVNVFTMCVQADPTRCRREMMIELSILKPEMSLTTARRRAVSADRTETAQTAFSASRQIGPTYQNGLVPELIQLIILRAIEPFPGRIYGLTVSRIAVACLIATSRCANGTKKTQRSVIFTAECRSRWSWHVERINKLGSWFSTVHQQSAPALPC